MTLVLAAVARNIKNVAEVRVETLTLNKTLKGITEIVIPFLSLITNISQHYIIIIMMNLTFF